MADISKFRSALGGFNREDVVNYIESMSLEQQKQLRKLQEENEKLRSEKNALAELLAAANSDLSTLREQDAALSEQVELLAQQAAELAGQVKAESEKAPEETSEAAEPVDYTSLELEAYRRAEQTERNAAVRADKIYRQLTALCEHARERYSDAGDEIAALSEDLTANLGRLQETLAELRLVFDEAENAFDEMDLPQQS
ncbi:MAG: hypothetical protein MRZ24_05420 [Clostridiales bacterium]|nr:hypothetical protein [Clostridiales bacterium]